MVMPVSAVRRLYDRTPLRTKLITAVLGLVILALAAISVASSVMLGRYVTTQRDPQLQTNFQNLFQGQNTRVVTSMTPGDAAALNNGTVLGIQLPGHQLTWMPSQGYPNMSGTEAGPLPSLPTSAGWAGTNSPVTLTAQSLSGADTWRAMAALVKNFPVSDGNGGVKLETVNVVLAVDLGNIGALTTRLEVFDLVVGGAIVVVLAAVGAAVVQRSLRPLNDIELTAGQIAAGHLEHRVPEGDPRTEIGSLGRSLNAMLSQIERAFHAQEASEQAAHQSEERMRRFIADASHELRTPLTTIRGFAAHYRQRGGSSHLRPGELAQSTSFRTDAASSSPAVVSPGAGSPADGLSPGDLDHLMGRVEAEATRMGLLVEDLLTLARLDQQRPLSKGPVDLLTLAADAVQDARIVSPGRPIDLIVAPGTAFLVDGDESRLRQVLANLVNNAITHTPAGTPVRVKIARGSLEAPAADGGGFTGGTGFAGGTDVLATAPGASRVLGPGGAGGAGGQGDWGGSAGQAEPAVADVRQQSAPDVVPAVVLDVEDDGPGMTTDQAQRVFERFYRADAARNRASGGTGLGLAIVAGLVSAHGGTVSVRTAPGQGADFQVKLPLSPDALAVDDSDADSDSDSEDDLPG
jgi:two-component system, OmpR family, sensor kinase